MLVAGCVSEGLLVRRPQDKVVKDEQGALKVAGLAAKRTGSTVQTVLPFFVFFAQAR